MKVIVVGGGIVGTSLAHSLIRRNHEVLLVEAEDIGSGTTSTSYAWLNSHKKHPESYHAINSQGLQHWAETLVPARPDIGELNGHVEIAVDKEHRRTLSQRLERLHSLGYRAEWITPSEARGLVPLQIPEDSLVGHFPGEGHAYPQQLTKQLMEEMQQSFRFTLVREAAISVSPDTAALTLASRRVLDADVVALCTGNATTDLAATAGVQVPMVPRDVGGAAFGYLGYAQAPTHGLRGPVTTDLINLRPNGPDSLLLQSLDLDATADPASPVSEEVRIEMLQRAKALLPDQQVQLDDVRVGHRVIPGDGLTVAGPAPTHRESEHLWISVTHSGIVLGPWLGETIAEEISGGAPHPLLEDFRPDRFHTRDAQVRPEEGSYRAPRQPGDQ